MTSSGAERPLVVITEELDESAEAWLRDRCDVERCTSDDPRFGPLIEKARALIVRTYTRVDQGLIERAARLKVVGRAGVGVDNIDVSACRARGIEVVHTPEANTRAVIELVTGFMLDAVRPRSSLHESLCTAEWKARRAAMIAPRQLSDLTLGILGLGRVGRGMARVGGALEMRVLYNDLVDIDPSQRHGGEPVDLDDLFARSDVLTVHVDHRPSNRHFVNTDRLRCLPRGAIFINASRGFVVHAEALAHWLRDDPAASAFLDVHDPEPLEKSSPLLGLTNATLTPHIGAATRTAHQNMSRVVEDVWRVLQGEAPRWRAP